MKKRKRVALMLVCIMIMQLLPMQILGNPQAAVTDVKVLGKVGHKENPVTKAMTPSITIAWSKPETIPGKPGSQDNLYDWDGEHEIQFYQIELYNHATGGQSILSDQVDRGATSTRLEERVYGYDAYGKQPEKVSRLENGSIYTVKVIPRHIHLAGVNDQNKQPAKIEGISDEVHIATDFDTKVEVTDSGLEVSWEYIPGADYRIKYAEGTHTTKQGVDGANPIEISISAKDAATMRDPANMKRVKHVIRNVQPKQKYSVYVELLDFKSLDGRITMDDLQINREIGVEGPKVVQETTAINIDIRPVGGNMIEIYWGEFSWATMDESLEYIEVWASPDKNGEFKKVAEKYHALGTKLDSIVIEEAKEDMYYQVKFKFKGSKELEESNIKLHSFTPITAPPTNPKIPKPFGPYVDIKEEKPADYLVKDDLRDFTMPNFIESTFHGKAGGSAEIQLVWDAPNVPGDSKKKDLDLLYDIWVTDNVEAIRGNADIPKIIDTKPINSNEYITKYNAPEEIIGFKKSIQYYVDEFGEIKPLKKNHTYYIKLVAKREVPSNKPGESKFIESQPTIVAITMDKDGHIFPPPVIGKPPLRIQEDSTTATSLTVEWLTNWWEVLAKDLSLYKDSSKREKILAEVGASVVYAPEVPATTGPALRLETLPKHTMYELFNGIPQSLYTAIGGKEKFDSQYYKREVKLDETIQYEMEVLEYSDLEERMNKANMQEIEEWMQYIASNDKVSGLEWNDIKPEPKDEEDTNNKWIEYQVKEVAPGVKLEPNTRYVIMIRAYRMVDGERIPQSFPTYTIGTTHTDYVGPEPTPTTPDLHLKVDSEKDTSFEVYWNYNSDFRYEIRYSTEDDPEKAKVFEFTVVDSQKEEDRSQNKYYFHNGKDAYLTIRGLFPETTYNVWIKAFQKKGDKFSGFSTPVTATTTEIAIPDMPTGLGPASKESIKDAGKDFDPVGKDYITVEWTKNSNDFGKETEGNITKWYEYDVEFADNVEFLNSTKITVDDQLGSKLSAEILAKSLVRFNKLLANRPYYIRVKTRIVMEDSESKNKISKESAYCKWIRIMTKKSGDEYDGGDNDNIVTYPDKVEQDYDNGIWEWEIVDAQGTITDIVGTTDYFYTIDMALYEGRYDARIRRILMPVSVLQALVGQRMEIKVITNVGVYEIPAHALSYKLEKVQAKDTVQFDFETMLAYDLKDMSKPYPYIVEGGEKLSISIKSRETGNKNIEYFDAPIDVALKLKEKTAYQNNTYKTYTYDYSKGDWIEGSHMVQTKEEATYLNYRNDRTGIYTVYRVDTYHDIRDINYGMQQLLANYNIVNLGTIYKEQDRVYSDQYINLMLGLAQGIRDIQLDGYVGSAAKDKARITKLYVPSTSGYITQEEAINGVVRLYEMKAGYRVKPSSKTFNEVSPQYRETVAKAHTLGLMESIDPKKEVTYGDLCTWIHMVLPN